ncbi:hypothetical protein DDI_2597 [Dickeya dianthicola RNS04.9]|nr:hypothetical protein DDI_2597 [Dickeya dianthicola RNS04.9]
MLAMVLVTPVFSASILVSVEPGCGGCDDGAVGLRPHSVPDC